MLFLILIHSSSPPRARSVTQFCRRRCKDVVGHLQATAQQVAAIRSEPGRLVQVVQIAQQAFLLVAHQMQQRPVVVRMLGVTLKL